MAKRILFTLILGIVLSPSALAVEGRRPARSCGYGQKSMDCYQDGRAFFCDRQVSQKSASQPRPNSAGSGSSSISAN